MLKNVRLGTTLVGGVVLVSLLVLIVGFFGWNGARRLQDHIVEIGEVRLPSIEYLQRNWNEFVAVWESWRDGNNSIVQMAKKIDALFAEPPGLHGSSL